MPASALLMQAFCFSGAGFLPSGTPVAALAASE